MATAAPVSLAEYMALGGPAPTARIAYGKEPSQFVEVFTPAGDGPYPVVVLVHGGCWWKKYGGIEQFRGVAGALVADHIAVWSIEYRRIDEHGGGYPGTYLDVAAALDLLSLHAASYHLDLTHIVAVGHSAGGLMVQWLAGRARIPPSSPLYPAHPLPIKHVVGLSSINDLRAWTDLCGFPVSRLTGTRPAGRPDVFADTSPAELLPNGTQTVLVNGELEHQVPPEVATRFAAKARAAGDRVETVVLAGAGHFDAVTPTSSHWPEILRLIEAALRAPAGD